MTYDQFLKSGGIAGGANLGGTLNPTNTPTAGGGTSRGWVGNLLQPLSFQAPTNTPLAGELSQSQKATFQTNAIIVVVLGTVFILGIVGLFYILKK